MIHVSPQTRILLQVGPLDYRKGLDSLVGMCREVLGENPFSGTLFVFRNRKRTSIKMLFYDGQGFWVCQKRFSEGKLRYWPEATTSLTQLAARELYTLIWNGDPSGAKFAPEWRQLPIAS